MNAVGNFAIVQRMRETTSTGIMSQHGNIGLCISCSHDKSIVNQYVLVHGRHKYETHGDYMFVPYEYIFCTLSREEF